MNGEHRTPPGKEPLDYLLWLREISSAEFSRWTGINHQEIGRYRKGMKPKPEHRKKISEELGVSEADLGWAVEGVNA